jgi:hypothetical protein
MQSGPYKAPCSGPDGSRASGEVVYYMIKIDPEFPAWVRAGGQKRQTAFDFVEEIYGDMLRNGEDGIALYRDLLEKVRQSRDPEAVRQFQARFAQMLDQKLGAANGPEPHTGTSVVAIEQHDFEQSEKTVREVGRGGMRTPSEPLLRRALNFLNKRFGSSGRL